MYLSHPNSRCTVFLENPPLPRSPLVLEVPHASAAPGCQRDRRDLMSCCIEELRFLCFFLLPTLVPHCPFVFEEIKNKHEKKWQKKTWHFRNRAIKKQKTLMPSMICSWRFDGWFLRWHVTFWSLWCTRRILRMAGWRGWHRDDISTFPQMFLLGWVLKRIVAATSKHPMEGLRVLNMNISWGSMLASNHQLGVFALKNISHWDVWYAQYTQTLLYTL